METIDLRGGEMTGLQKMLENHISHMHKIMENIPEITTNQDSKITYKDVGLDVPFPEFIALLNEHFQNYRIPTPMENPDQYYQILRIINENFDSPNEVTEDTLGDILDIKESNHIFLNSVGRGAIKKAYLAENEHSGKKTILLSIEPSSIGFKKYSSFYPGLSEEALISKIVEQEFAATELINLKRRRYLGLITGPLKGHRHRTDEEIYLLQTQRYDHTFQDEMDKPMHPERAFRLHNQLVEVLTNCHKEGIVHKDLTPANTGIDKYDDVMLSDFGGISLFSASPGIQYQYPLVTRPPELVPGHPEFERRIKEVKWFSDLFTPQANKYTAGMNLYRMIFGKYPIDYTGERAEFGTPEYDKQNQEVYEQILDNQALLNKVNEDIDTVASDIDLDKSIEGIYMTGPSEKNNEYFQFHFTKMMLLDEDGKSSLERWNQLNAWWQKDDSYMKIVDVVHKLRGGPDNELLIDMYKLSVYVRLKYILNFCLKEDPEERKLHTVKVHDHRLDDVWASYIR